MRFATTVTLLLATACLHFTHADEKKQGGPGDLPYTVQDAVTGDHKIHLGLMNRTETQFLMWYAVKEDKLEIVDKVLHTKHHKLTINSDCNRSGKGKRALLHVAATYCTDTATLIGLIERGAIIDRKDSMDRTAAHFAARNGNIECLRILLDKGADVHAPMSLTKETLLHMAVQNGHVEVVKLLIERGADLDAVTAIGDSTPIKYAVLGGKRSAPVLDFFIKNDYYTPPEKDEL